MDRAGDTPLFSSSQDPLREPLAARMRPRTIDEFVGQDHILGPGRLLRRAIQADRLASVIFSGPPGTGKTTLARVIANSTSRAFTSLNAVLSGVKDVREAVEEARRERDLYGRGTILFVDEVHRWNKAQQDALLPWVENGTVILIGATTENPFFEVNSALVSRSRVFQLTPLGPEDLRVIARRALEDPIRGYGRHRVALEPDALEHLVRVADGDARSLLGALELAVETGPSGFPPPPGEEVRIDLASAEDSIQRRAILYDKEGDWHYDTISAFIKSLRGSDPDAALYWMARMVLAGEDPRFIFRRMLILAGEDVGLADPQALGVVEAAARAFDRVGMPEGQYHLTQAALYLATCPKSNSALGYFDALKAVEAEGISDVPTHLKDSSRDAKGFGHGAGYRYPHAYRDHWVAQDYLPRELKERLFYTPSASGYEARIREEVLRRREARLEAVFAAPEEILTFSPGDSARDRWLERASSERNAVLEEVRDRIFAASGMLRHHRALVAGSAGGLLVWEALRRAPEGGVWALVPDEKALAALSAYAGKLPELERPFLLRAGPADLPRLEEPLPPMDVVMGRNLLTREPDRAGVLGTFFGVLAPGGVLSLGEVVPSRGSRLFAAAGTAGLPPGLGKKLLEAEEGLYRDRGNPLVSWGPRDLEAALADGGFSSPAVSLEFFEERRTVSPENIAAWFGLSVSGSGSSGGGPYADLVRELLDENERRDLAAWAEERLAGKALPWRTCVAFLTGRRPS